MLKAKSRNLSADQVVCKKNDEKKRIQQAHKNTFQSYTYKTVKSGKQRSPNILES